MKSKILGLLAVGLLAGPMADAGIVFQSVADLNDSSQINTYGWCSSCSGNYRIFDKFTLSTSETITGFSVSLYAGAGYWPADIDFSVWTVGGGNLPGAQLFGQNIAAANFTSTAISGAMLSVIAETDDVTGLTLAAGTYYVSFYNPGSFGDGLAVNGYSGGGGNLYQQGNQFHVGSSAGFTLTNGTVPEPGTLALLGLGLAGLGLSRRRKAN